MTDGHIWRGRQRDSFSLCAHNEEMCYGRTQRDGGHLLARKRGVTRHGILPNLDLRLSSPWNCQKIHFYCLSHAVCWLLLLQQNRLTHWSTRECKWDQQAQTSAGKFSTEFQSQTETPLGLPQPGLTTPSSGVPQLKLLIQHVHILPDFIVCYPSSLMLWAYGGGHYTGTCNKDLANLCGIHAATRISWSELSSLPIQL